MRHLNSQNGVLVNLSLRFVVDHQQINVYLHLIESSSGRGQAYEPVHADVRPLVGGLQEGEDGGARETPRLRLSPVRWQVAVERMYESTSPR